MKRHILILATVIISMAFVSCTITVDGETFGGKTIKGDGNIVTQNYTVSAFNEISTSLPATVNFTIADEYTCSVRVDENILEYLDIKVDEHDLILKKQDQHKNINLHATEFVIEVTAPSMEDINLAGSGTLNVLSPMEGEELEVNLAGSGDIVFNETVNVQEVELNVAGSGNIDCNEVLADKLDANVAGSGDLSVKTGNVRKAEVSVAGSGDCVLTCEIETLEANIAGSGDIKARVNDKLEYSIIGSGDIAYYGNPSVVQGDKVGSGSVTRLDE